MNITTRDLFLTNHEMTLKFFTFQAMTSVLNLIKSRLNDFAHNEFFDLMKRVMFIICADILIKVVLQIFIKKFRFFFLFVKYKRL